MIMMYMVTAKRHYYDFEGVEVAGIFDDAEKAYAAKLKVEQWLKDKVYVEPCDVNWLKWYSLEEKL